MKQSTIVILIIVYTLFNYSNLFSYDSHLKATRVEKGPRIDGNLDDAVWQQAELFSNFKMVKPQTGVPPSEKTELRVLYDTENLYIGIHCYVKDISTISVTGLTHDQRGDGNDVVRILLDPFQDKRNGYVFFVNARGSRTDGLATGERFSTNWDGIWDAKSKIHQTGWSTEIKIPFKTLAFNPKLNNWGFNVERYIPSRQEVIRMSGINKNSFFYNPSEAALLKGIQQIKQGKGITFKPYATIDMSQDYEAEKKREWKLNGGFDLYKNFTPNLVGVLTYQTDFAETEVDERQINLTRFGLFFPEKRAFFLEGSEVFDFGNSGGFRPSFIPFFSRNIGLFEEEQVPINWGAKVYGKIGKTNLALLDVKTKSFADFGGQNFFAGRVYQNIFSQSKVGMIFTSGQPGSNETNTLFGLDFNYSTSRFLKNKNFAFIGWWVTNKNQYTEGSHQGYGFKLDYPNDLFDISINYHFFGDSLEPGLGFLPRNDVHKFFGAFQYRPRPEKGFLGRMVRQIKFQVFATIFWDLQGRLESSRISMSPFTVLKTESGDELEFFVIAFREVLDEPFDVTDDVLIVPGDYTYTRYQFKFETAKHRAWVLEMEYETGGFFGGDLSKFEVELDFNFKGNIKLGVEGEFIRADLPEGKFEENLYQAKADFYLNPDIGLLTFLQYDSVSENIGANFRFKWRISPGNIIYLVYDRSWERRFDPMSRFFPLQDRGIFKIQFSWRP
ncbi:MAG: carbohydrate binding family 9 domain-containing protein [bacterium]|nr:carbohydrate binding family 9 domain-containing protein [bacterium]